MQSDITIEIDAPIEVVFDAACHHVAEWSTVVKEDEVLHETPEVVGSTFRVVTEDRGRKMEFEGVVTIHEQPTRSGATMAGKSFDIEVDYTLEDLGGKTRLRQVTACHGKGFAKLIFFVMKPFMGKAACDANNKELAGLKAFAEKRAAGE